MPGCSPAAQCVFAPPGRRMPPAGFLYLVSRPGDKKTRFISDCPFKWALPFHARVTFSLSTQNKIPFSFFSRRDSFSFSFSDSFLVSLFRREVAAQERLDSLQVWYNRHRLSEMIQKLEEKEAIPLELAFEQSLLSELRSHVGVGRTEPKRIQRAREEEEAKERELQRALDSDADVAKKRKKRL
jgi:hypothetical protein